FVAFDKEEEGLVGSAAFVKSIPKESRINYCWMVNVDSFGFSPPQVMDNTTTTKMLETAETTAKNAGFTLHHAVIAGADADSSSFKAKGIPSITFHGLNPNWQRYLHTSNDKFENINVPMVLDGYSFVLRYLAKTDTLGCSEFRK
ncbi:MAG: M28 family peptidase, partial [Pyrinomonadaceae bacterium]